MPEQSDRAPEILANGPGTWETLRARTPLLGTGGEPVRIRARVERGLLTSNRALVGNLKETLFDRRGWPADGRWDLQLVENRSADVVIHWATPDTVDEHCHPLQTNGIFSCRQGKNLYLNFWRWQAGADGFASINRYRRYLINHELGHSLGFDHYYCPEPGKRAPIMLQQSIDLNGCRANGWPYPENVSTSFQLRLLDRFVPVDAELERGSFEFVGWLDRLGRVLTSADAGADPAWFEILVQRRLLAGDQTEPTQDHALKQRYDTDDPIQQRLGLLLELESLGIISFGSPAWRRYYLVRSIRFTGPGLIHRFRSSQLVSTWRHQLPRLPYKGPYRQIVTDR